MERAKFWTKQDCHKTAQEFLHDETGSLPFPKFFTLGCMRGSRADPCLRGEMLNICQHDVEGVLKQVDGYGDANLKRERLKWHPDRSPGSAAVQVLTQERFQLIQRLIDNHGKVLRGPSIFGR